MELFELCFSEEDGGAENQLAFANLVLLMSELIQNDVFSHDAYMCTLLARGDLMSPALASGSFSLPEVIDLSSVKSEIAKPDVCICSFCDFYFLLFSIFA